MKPTEFNSKITSEKLNESMFKKFGTRVNFEKYTREQLEDVRNKLRTKVSQTESSSGFNELLSSEGYQKDKFMLNLLNTRIKEMLGESMLAEKAKSKAQQKFMGMVYAAKKGGKPASKEVAKAAKGMSKKAAKDFAKTKRKGLPDKVGESWDNPTPAEKRATADRKQAQAAVRQKIDQQTLRPRRPQLTGSEGEEERVAAQRAVAKKIFDKERADRAAERDARRPAGTKPIGKIKLLTRENNMKTNEAKKAKSAKPDYIDIDGDGNTSEPMKAAAKSMRKKKTSGGPFGKSKTAPAKPKKDTENPFGKGKGPKSPKDNSKGKNPFAKGKKKAVKESSIRQNYAMIIEGLKRFIAEDEEGKAKDITAGSDMVNDFTSWMQRVGQYQTKSMIELADSIRSNFGQAEAENFKNTVSPALQSALESLTAAREVVSKAVAVLAGEENTEVPMGQSPEVGPEAEPSDIDSMNSELEQDEFGASDAAVGGAETAGRETRESREYSRLKKINEEHSIIRKLAG
jgi:hypothetical protein